jgi:hypothetical protein
MLGEMVLTLLTALTVWARSSVAMLILIVRVSARPSRVKENINAQKAKECLRTPRPARRDFSVSLRFFFDASSPARSVAARRRSEAVPTQLPRSAMSFRMQNCYRVRFDNPFDCGFNAA